MKEAVTARDLVVSYGDAVALDRSTFLIPRGSVTAVIGPNGSGKSTLLNAIAGLIEPRSGSISVPARSSGSHRIAYQSRTELPDSKKETKWRFFTLTYLELHDKNFHR